ncbi:hypothetical protein [Arthrobacter caoxuetaonis]|uniref:Uncharacterized protein n=1 Tax=Arthrobacter caoxuetaonis TaxID=2886935 RepID=A0A9X1MHA5_9MICC|nr:hypothetical protein [Arthrobacter caoxuetaonis]MCC3299342.1 hypothetical protein [Arthrobacter caoxuetaonis]USQ59165.1 hypothetical protein NF551_18840 [Arthrobacter caoxuetaonis]
MTAILTAVLVWFSASGLALAVNAFLAAGRSAGDSEAERALAAAANAG